MPPGHAHGTGPGHGGGPAYGPPPGYGSPAGGGSAPGTRPDPGGHGHEHGSGSGSGSGSGGGSGHGSGGGSGHGSGGGSGSGDGHGGGGHGHGSRGGSGADGGGHGHGSGGGHGHSHAHGPAAPASRRLRRIIAAVLVPFAAAVAVGLLVLWPGGAPDHERSGVGFDRHTEQGTVTRVEKTPCGQQNQKGQECSLATVRIDSGKDEGHTFTETVQKDQSRQLAEGDSVIVAYEPSAPKELQYSVMDMDRKFPLALLAGIFAVAVVVVGRLRGLMALIALAVSFLVLTLFILPAILQGSNPLVVAVVGSSAIMLIALYLCHGLSARTSVAVLGTLVSLLLIGVLGSVFIDWGDLTGNTDDNTGLIHGLYPQIDMSGLLLAGIIIGSLGVLDDVTVTQTSAVWELHEANPSLGPRGLYRAGLRIGRDHIASVVNTLVLAYAGAALPLLLLFSIARSSVGAVANSELVAQEIVRTLIGSIGLVASVPVTTALAALVVAADRPAPDGRGGLQAGGRGRGSRGRRRRR